MGERGFGERAVIERIARLVSASARKTAGGGRAAAVHLGIGDDCAILRPPAGHEVLVTTDLFLEGRHFRRDWHSAESAGHRCLARGLSDLAAMGAAPHAAFLSIALPAGFDSGWFDGFLSGLLQLAGEHGVQLSGGDTAQAPGADIMADIMLIGSAPRGQAIRRSGARVGDSIYVTGALGGSAAELEGLAAKPFPKRQPGLTRQTFPEPRLAVGRILRSKRIASAAIDLSDGLSTDLAHLCAASGVAAEIERESLPLDALAAGRGGLALNLALNGGEDYELLFTAGAKVPGRIAGVAVTRIGRVVSGKGVWLTAAGRRERLENGGFEHFSQPPKGAGL